MALSDKLKELEANTLSLIELHAELARVIELVYERLVGYHKILRETMSQEEIEKKLYEHRTSTDKRPINITTRSGVVLDGMGEQQENR